MTPYTPIPTSDLPTWMRRSLRGSDWGALLSLAFGLLIALTILWQTGLPRSNDSEHWVFQTANTAAAIQEGQLYPRWSPHALGGYGAPIPNYYPPAPAYFAALIQIVLTGDPVEAVRIVMFIAVGLAGVPVYGWVSRRAGAAAGIIAAMLYVYSPLVGYVTPITMGDLPAVLSHLLVPSLMSFLDRFLTYEQPLDFIAIALTLAALLLTDIRFAGIAIALALVYIGWHVWQKRDSTWRAALLVLLLGALSSAFYWLPAVWERDAVQWQQISPMLTYRIDLATLFAPLRQPDPLNTVITPQFTLGTPILFFLIIGIWAVFRGQTKFHGLFLVISLALILIVFWVPTAAWLLGILALTTAIGSAGTVALRMHFSPRLRALSLALLVLIASTSALPMWLAHQHIESFGDVSPTAQVQYELQGFGIAGLPRGWLLPSTLPANLPYNQSLINSYNTNNITKIDTSNLNSDAQIGFLEHTTHSDRFQIQSAIPTQINLLTAAFPGWVVNATLGSVTLASDPESGLLRLDFPATFNSDLTVSLNTTLPRTAGWVVSCIALLTLGIVTRTRTRQPPDYLNEYPLLHRSETRAVTFVLIFVAAVALLALNNGLSVLQNRRGAELDSSTPLRVRSEVGMEAIGFVLDETVTQIGDTIDLTLYWRALRYLDENYRVQVSLVPLGEDLPVLTTPLQHPAGYPTRRWLTGRYVTDSYRILLPATLSLGQYSLRVEVFDCETGCIPDSRLTFFDPQGTALGQSLILPVTIQISS